MCETLTIHRFFRKTWRYMDAYRKGLDSRQTAFAVHKYKSHRRNLYTSLKTLFTLTRRPYRPLPALKHSFWRHVSIFDDENFKLQNCVYLFNGSCSAYETESIILLHIKNRGVLKLQ
ncbi:hypothetical protein DFH29DRAFT_429060 [Suillus ampliporus]|nr:hypothetical protein DFH29DRAFT_429060 [Suillus ampliporus]